MRSLFFLAVILAFPCKAHEENSVYKDFLFNMRNRHHTAEDMYHLFAHIIKEQIKRDSKKTDTEKPWYQKGIEKGLIPADPYKYISRVTLADIDTTKENKIPSTATLATHVFFALPPYLSLREECATTEFFVGHFKGKLPPDFIPTLHHECQHFFQRLNACAARHMGYHLPAHVKQLPSSIGSSPERLHKYVLQAATLEGEQELERNLETEADTTSYTHSPFELVGFSQASLKAKRDEIFHQYRHVSSLLAEKGYLTPAQTKMIYEKRINNTTLKSYLFNLVPQMWQFQLACNWQHGMKGDRDVYENRNIRENLLRRLQAYTEISLFELILKPFLAFHVVAGGTYTAIRNEASPALLAALSILCLLVYTQAGLLFYRTGTEGIQSINHWPERLQIIFSTLVSSARYHIIPLSLSSLKLPSFSFRNFISTYWPKQRTLKEKMLAGSYTGLHNFQNNGISK